MAVRVMIDPARVVGTDSYDHEVPFIRLLQDALALPIFDGGNMGIRRLQLHPMFKQSNCEPLAASGAT
jgi:butyryl-CoA dehydrogenase